MKKKRGPGHPPAKIHKDELEKLCSLQCTQGEIAAYFKVSRRTIETYAQKEDFKPIFERGRELGMLSVRRQQFKLLEAGNVTMAIWLGKQLLGQKDKVDIAHGGGGGTGPIETTDVSPRERLLSRIAQLAERRRSGGSDPKP